MISTRSQWLLSAAFFLLCGTGLALLWGYLWFYAQSWATTFAVFFTFVCAGSLGMFITSVVLAFSKGASPWCGPEEVDKEKLPLIEK